MKSKIALVYQSDSDSSLQIETVWAEQEKGFFRIKNIPFFAKNIAYDDLVSTEVEDDMLYFDSLVEPSGNSTIRIVILSDETAQEVGQQLTALGCGWEGSHLKNLISVNVPASINYQKVSELLNQRRRENKWDFEEACLGFL